MTDSEALTEFKEGMALLRNGIPRKAISHFAKAAELDLRNPFYFSYLGLAFARADENWAKAEELCLSAVRMKRTQPELYLNLAEVYSLEGKTEDAAETLIAGLHFTKRDARLATALRKLGLRRPSVVPFLGRKNVVNRGLGRLRHKVLKSLDKET